ncbi:hypothetical protein QFC21_003913 [Naganishia friedmannii]|uniref:Uncharacterized protein n=1 Tax=Naganishia friedmannii TaxID=89922 RepID=A0ACC2VKJ5_9TREE|nr:hypothetical protein QFC21_003913 [Naganishia friedmannii]
MTEVSPIVDLPNVTAPSSTSQAPLDVDTFDACTCHDDGVGCSLHNSHEYLCRIELHQRLFCQRTQLPVTYMDAGDPDGVPLLFVLPSGCTRWVGIQLEPLARRYGVRLIALDRPGCGGTQWVDLAERIDTSADMMLSVLEHLRIQIKHIMVASGGIYYALRFLNRHARNVLHQDEDGSVYPRLYNIAPWSPVLTGDEGYFQPLNLVPTSLIKVQHQLLPTLIPALEFLGNAFEGSSMLVKDTRKRMPWWSGGVTEKQEKKIRARCRETFEGELWQTGHWEFIQNMINLENLDGIGQEHLICLNRGCHTGGEWFQRELEDLRNNIRDHVALEQLPGAGRLEVETWWGDQDGMVPKKGQESLYRTESWPPEWLNKLFASKSDVMDYVVYHIKDGNHNDL